MEFQVKCEEDEFPVTIKTEDVGFDEQFPLTIKTEDVEMDDQFPVAIKTEEVEIVSELSLDNVPRLSAEHYRVNDLENQFRCYVCGTLELFANDDHLQQHLVAGHPHQETYHCEQCNIWVNNISLYNRHLFQHDEIKRYPCRFCPLRFSAYKKRKEHELCTHSDTKHRRFSCSTCGKKYVHKNKLELHQSLHLQDEPEAKPPAVRSNHRCYMCSNDTKFDSQSALHKHLVENHELTDKYKCSACDYSCLRISQFNKHLARHDTTERPFQCSLCSLRFTEAGCLLNHEVCVHGLENGFPKRKKNGDMDKRFACSTCGKLFPFKYQVKKHEEMVHRPTKAPASVPVELRIKCYSCAEKNLFKSKADLLYHFEKVHPIPQMYKCKDCNFVTIKMSTFNNHLSQHDPIASPFKCSFCEYRFKTKDAKERHQIRVHQTKPSDPHTCTVCNQQFAFKSKLLVHIHYKGHFDKSNPDIQPLPNKQTVRTKRIACSFCDMPFTSNYYKIQHELSKHPDASNRAANIFQCQLCSTKPVFNSQNALMVHTSCKHPPQPSYECDLCSYTTNAQTEFDSHCLEHCATNEPSTSYQVQQNTIDEGVMHADIEVKEEPLDEDY